MQQKLISPQEIKSTSKICLWHQCNWTLPIESCSLDIILSIHAWVQIYFIPSSLYSFKIVSFVPWNHIQCCQSISSGPQKTKPPNQRRRQLKSDDVIKVSDKDFLCTDQGGFRRREAPGLHRSGLDSRPSSSLPRWAHVRLGQHIGAARHANLVGDGSSSPSHHSVDDPPAQLQDPRHHPQILGAVERQCHLLRRRPADGGLLR